MRAAIALFFGWICVGCTQVMCDAATTCGPNATLSSDSTMTWQAASDAPRTATPTMEGGNASACFVAAPIYAGSEAPIAIDCPSSVGALFFTFTLDDPTAWRAGVQTRTGDAAHAVLSLLENDGKCTKDLDASFVFTITVERATGSATSIGATADYDRVFRIDFDTSTAAHPVSNGTHCEVPISMKGTLRFEQTAQDVEARASCTPACG